MPALAHASIAWLHGGRVAIMGGAAWLYSPAGARAQPVGEGVTGLPR